MKPRISIPRATVPDEATITGYLNEMRFRNFMSIYLVDPCKEQPLANAEANKITQALDGLRAKLPPARDAADAILGPNESAVDTLLAASRLGRLVTEQATSSGPIPNGSYSITTTLPKSGFCSTTAQISILTQVVNGQSPQSDYKMEQPVVTAETTAPAYSIIKSNVARIDFQTGVKEEQTQTEFLKAKLTATNGVLLDRKATQLNRTQAIVDFLTTADMAIASGIEEITNSNLLKSTRKRDTKVLSWVENSVEDFRKLNLQFQGSVLGGGPINTDGFMKAIGSFKATCAALASVE